jgi:hypothetical protein
MMYAKQQNVMLIEVHIFMMRDLVCGEFHGTVLTAYAT